MRASSARRSPRTNKHADSISSVDDDGCVDCKIILDSLERIDERAHRYGIDIVRINSAKSAKTFHIYNPPALVYFRKKNAVLYDGDLLDSEKLITWLTSPDMFQSEGGEIELVNRQLLEKLLDDHDFLLVFFR